MKTQQFTTSTIPAPRGRIDADVILAFGSVRSLKQAWWREEISRAYGGAIVFGCSTAGQIKGTAVVDDEIVLTAIALERSTVRTVGAALAEDARETGKRLGNELRSDELRHVLVLSEGVRINGTQLVEGLRSALPEGVTITGGLSGDGDRFRETCVLVNGRAQRGIVGAIGLYGKGLRVGYGSYGGWDPFGPERVITRSRGNVLYELDGGSALALYKRYLGEDSEGLPATGLQFPLYISKGEQSAVVRTLLGVDETDQSMVFAGEMPEGANARLMTAAIDRLIGGAEEAARRAMKVTEQRAEVAILISCVGRRLLLNQRVEEEVEAVRQVLGAVPTLTGFYSYGEISPFGSNTQCELHNQTMTITLLSEA